MSRKMGAYQFIVKSIRNTLYEHHQLDASPSIKILMELNFAIFFHIVCQCNSLRCLLLQIVHLKDLLLYFFV